MGLGIALKRTIRESLVSLAASRLEKQGKVRRAPTYALIEVEPQQNRNLELQISDLAAQFDVIKILWHGDEPPSFDAKNVEIYVKNAELRSRWQLLGTCQDGFIFPISLEKPVGPDHVKHLKKHLFNVGPSAMVGLLNLGLVEPVVESAHRATDLVPVPTLDLDYAVFDQRYWSISETRMTSPETLALSREAKSRGFSLFACHSAEVVSAPKKIKDLAITRADLIESLLNHPQLAKTLDTDRAIFWSKVWDTFGLRYTDEGSPYLEKSMKKLFAKLDPPSTNSKALAKTLIGKPSRRSLSVK